MVELGIVIGRASCDLVEAACDAIAGHMVVSAVSQCAFQMARGGQWAKGKSAATFNPAGPWLLTPGEINDGPALDWVSGRRRRPRADGTVTMIFDPCFIVHSLGQFIWLEPGDLINTGTPPVVGPGSTPPVGKQPGNVTDLGIEGLGSQRQSVLGPR